MSLYSGFFHSSFMASIQEFWLVMVEAADRMATSPLPPSVLAIICTCLAPISGVEEAERWTMRPAGAMAESKLITLMPRSHGLLADRHERIRVIGRDDDAVDLLGDLRVDHRDLLFGGRLGGSRVDDLDAAEFLGRFLGAVGAGVEIAVAEVLHDHGDALVGGKRLARDDRRSREHERRLHRQS